MKLQYVFFAPLQTLIEKAKSRKRKIARKHTIPIHAVENSYSGSNEPLLKRPRKVVDVSIVQAAPIGPVTVVPTAIDPERPEGQSEEVRIVDEEAERPIVAGTEVITVVVDLIVPAVLPVDVPTIDSLNPTLGIMEVVNAVNVEEGE